MRSLRAIALLLLAGCGLQMDLPPGFLRLSAQESGDLRAVTAADARIWVREFTVDDGATLDYWCEAIGNELRQARGYELADAGEVHDAAGRKGRAFRGSVVVAGEKCGYFAAVFLLPGSLFTHDTVRIVEFAAREDAFGAQVDAVQKAVASLR